VSRPEELRAAVAAGALAGEEAQASLLQSIADVARAIFGARASSIMTHAPETRELVFAAVSGEGSGELIGRRFPDSRGIAGWVLSARQPLVVEDVASDPRFARDLADSTGYVPSGLMSAPLLRADRVLGVLSVLDRPEKASFSLSEMDLLGLFAHQAAIAIEIAGAARQARATLERAEPDLEDLAAAAELLGGLEGRQRERAAAFVYSLRELLAGLSYPVP
jgi:GAF domain-containing protein